MRETEVGLDGWCEGGVNDSGGCHDRGMTVEAAQKCAKDRKAWRALVHL